MNQQSLSYTLRPIGPSDIETLVEFLNKEEQAEGTVEGTTVAAFSEAYNSPDNSSTYMLAFLQRPDGSEGPLTGQMEFVDAEPGKAMGLLHVHHDYRNRGIGTALYAEFLKLAAQKGVTTAVFPPGARATCHREFLERRGYTLDRYWWLMRLAPDVPVGEPILPEGFTLRTFRHGQDEQLYTDIRNATFAGSYNTYVRTLEEMTARTRLAHFRPEDIVFAYQSGDIAGLCFTEVRPGEEDGQGAPLGRLQTIGVLPQYRNRGLGRALVLTGVNYLRRFVPVIELNVAGRNDPAIHLYESIGFVRHRGWTHLRRTFEPGELR